MPVEELTLEDSILADVRAACYLEREDDSYDAQLIRQLMPGKTSFYTSVAQEYEEED